ncbi:MAG: 50S ribosomal protein L29 [Candidatus Hydrogenedentes bacterium]|nr:50S ribosomal protein L29 [Candidatus Hydrogenedentota bacterium]
MSEEALAETLRDRGKALNNFRVQMATGSVDNVRAARNARRDIGRINTILRERELEATKGKK